MFFLPSILTPYYFGLPTWFPHAFLCFFCCHLFFWSFWDHFYLCFFLEVAFEVICFFMCNVSLGFLCLSQYHLLPNHFSVIGLLHNQITPPPPRPDDKFLFEFLKKKIQTLYHYIDINTPKRFNRFLNPQLSFFIKVNLKSLSFAEVCFFLNLYEGRDYSGESDSFVMRARLHKCQAGPYMPWNAI